jgi:hypothetical protein
MTSGEWETPLGKVQVDKKLATRLRESNKNLKSNPRKFSNEHSIEVELPLLQYLAQKQKQTVKIVPISVNTRDASEIDAIGASIAQAINNKNIKVLASSDMSHEHPRTKTDFKQQRDSDAKIINAFTRDDWRGVLEEGKDSTICGLQNIALLANIGERLGNSGKKLDYATSRDEIKQARSGDYNVGSKRRIPPIKIHF